MAPSVPLHFLLLSVCVTVALTSYAGPAAMGGVSDTLLLRELVTRMGNGLAAPSGQYLPMPDDYNDGVRGSKGGLYGGPSDNMELQEALELEAEREEAESEAGGPRLEDMELTVPRDIRDDLALSLGREVESPDVFSGDLTMHPSLRDREYMSHGHLLGNMLAQFPPGSSYGTMRIKPSGGNSPSATTERKTEGVLPAYCNPPNPCPIGYSASDSCMETFQNTAAFSRSYQSQQECMCDTEHMFDCPDTTRDTEIGALARSIQNEGALDSTLDKIMDEMRRNPYLQGDKLPVAAKKGVLMP